MFLSMSSSALAYLREDCTLEAVVWFHMAGPFSHFHDLDLHIPVFSDPPYYFLFTSLSGWLSAGALAL